MNRFLKWGLGFLVVFLFFLSIGQSILLYKKTKEIQTSYDVQVVLNKLVLDSLSKERQARVKDQKILTAKVDSMQALYNKSKSQLVSSQKDYASAIQNYETLKESLIGTDYIAISDCDSVVGSAVTHIDNLTESLVLCDSVSLVKSSIIHSLSLDTLSYSSSIRVLQDHSVRQDLFIKELQKKNSSWWSKNKAWVGFVSGVLVTGTGVVLLMN